MRSYRRASHAEYAVVEAQNLTRKPPNVSWEAAGSLAVAGSTAYASVQAVSLKPGDTVAVSGAAGGVGSLVVQLAKRTGAAPRLPSRRPRTNLPWPGAGLTPRTNKRALPTVGVTDKRPLPCDAGDKQIWHNAVWRLREPQGTRTAAPSKWPARRSARAWLACSSGYLVVLVTTPISGTRRRKSIPS